VTKFPPPTQNNRQHYHFVHHILIFRCPDWRQEDKICLTE
jgi:hypothetical protein